MSYRPRFLAGAASAGSPKRWPKTVFEQVRGFSEFGFPKAHAVALALLAYQSTWLRDR